MNVPQEVIDLIERLLLSHARMTLSLRATIASGVSPNKAVEIVKNNLEIVKNNPFYDSLATRTAEKVVAMIVEDMKQ